MLEKAPIVGPFLHSGGAQAHAFHVSKAWHIEVKPYEATAKSFSWN
jgi:hypothetical protein